MTCQILQTWRKIKMIKRYTGPWVCVTWAHKQEGINLILPGYYWGAQYKSKGPYPGTVLMYDDARASNDPFLL